MEIDFNKKIQNMSLLEKWLHIENELMFYTIYFIFDFFWNAVI